MHRKQWILFGLGRLDASYGIRSVYFSALELELNFRPSSIQHWHWTCRRTSQWTYYILSRCLQHSTLHCVGSLPSSTLHIGNNWGMKIKKYLRRPRTSVCCRVWAIQHDLAPHQTHHLFQWELYRSSYGTAASRTWTQDCRESISIPTLSFNYAVAKHSKLAPCPCLPRVPVANLFVGKTDHTF